MSKEYIILLCYLAAIVASFYGGRNYERCYRKWQAQKDVESIKNKYKGGKW